MPKKYTYYFSHDFNARSDEKIVKMRMQHGPAGYGVYWMLIEKLADVEDHKLKCDYASLAYDMRADMEMVRSVVEDFGLFVIIKEEEMFYSRSLTDRLERMDDLKLKRAEVGRLGGIAKKKNAEKRQKTGEIDILPIATDKRSKLLAIGTIIGSNCQKEEEAKNENLPIAKESGSKCLPIATPNCSKIKENIYIGDKSACACVCEEDILVGMSEFCATHNMTFVPNWSTQTTNVKDICAKLRQVFGEECPKEKWLEFLNAVWDKATTWERMNFNLSIINQKFGDLYNRAFKKVNYGQPGTTEGTASAKERLEVKQPVNTKPIFHI